MLGGRSGLTFGRLGERGGGLSTFLDLSQDLGGLSWAGHLKLLQTRFYRPRESFPRVEGCQVDEYKPLYVGQACCPELNHVRN